MSKEAMKLALEALEQYTNVVASVNNPDAWVTVVDAGKPAREAITAIREALASEAIEQPAQQQEPVAWMWRCKPYCDWPEWSVSLKRPADSGRDGHKRTEGYEDVPLYTSPPAQRKPWVGLTQQDIDIAFDDTQEGGGFDDFARAIEAKLKEKNA